MSHLIQDGRQRGTHFNIAPYGKIYFKSSPLKLLGQFEPNLVTIFVGWSHLTIVSDMFTRNPRWPPAGNIV